MEKTIFEKEYDANTMNDIFEDIHYEIENAELPSDKYGMFEGTITIKITYQS